MIEFSGRLIESERFGTIWLPTATIKYQNNSLSCEMLVDTGAYLSMIPYQVGIELGLTVSEDEILEAGGDFNLGSDIDVLIISNSLPEGFFKRIELLYHYVQGMIEPKGYTQTEFLNMFTRFTDAKGLRFHSNNPLAIDALKNGEILLDNGFWQKLMNGTDIGSLRMCSERVRILKTKAEYQTQNIAG
jgi:hypothetical protein